MSLRKIAVLSMLVVMLIAFNIPASFAQGVEKAGAAANAAVPKSANVGANAAAPLGAIGGAPLAPAAAVGFGGYGWPFNWGYAQQGIGCWPFNWALGGGWGPFSLLGWNHFSPCFGGGCGGCGIPSGISSGILATGGLAKGVAKAAVDQGMPFILGSPLGCSPVLGWDASSWAFGLQSCVRSLPLYFNAHGFGFPFTLGNYRIGFTPSCGVPCGCGPVCGAPAAIPAIGANVPLGGLAKGVAKAAVDQGMPFILGSPLGCSPVLGWDASSWAFGLQSCVRSLPLYFNAHGFGFPFTLGNYRVGFVPSC